MKFVYQSEFEKDLKRLLKRYISLNEDLIKIMSILEVYPNARPPFSFLLYNKSNTVSVIKIKKIACLSLRGKGVNTGLRMIYILNHKSNTIEFIELYHKNEKANEDQKRFLHLMK
jgi:mRNA-degrading endonuclease YafQ of YafQ-DinJ toxin-antitoxin module